MTSAFFSRTILLFAFSTILFSCKKNKDEDNKSRKELIVGSWQMTALSETPATNDYDGDGTNDSDLYQFTEACSRDNIITFSAGGTFTEDEGSTKCDADDDQIVYTSAYSFSEDESKLIADGQSLTIVDITSTTLKLSFGDSFNGQPSTQMVTYTRK